MMLVTQLRCCLTGRGNVSGLLGLVVTLVRVVSGGGGVQTLQSLLYRSHPSVCCGNRLHCSLHPPSPAPTWALRAEATCVQAVRVFAVRPVKTQGVRICQLITCAQSRELTLQVRQHNCAALGGRPKPKQQGYINSLLYERSPETGSTRAGEEEHVWGGPPGVTVTVGLFRFRFLCRRPWCMVTS